MIMRVSWLLITSMAMGACAAAVPVPRAVSPITITTPLPRLISPKPAQKLDPEIETRLNAIEQEIRVLGDDIGARDQAVHAKE